MIFLFCKCQGKCIYHLTAEIQVTIGWVSKLRTLHVPINYVKNLLKKVNEKLHAAVELLSMEDL